MMENEIHGNFYDQYFWSYSISPLFLTLTLSVPGTGTFLHNVYTSHVSEKKINSIEYLDPRGQSGHSQSNKY